MVVIAGDSKFPLVFDEYETARGTSYYQEYLDSLPDKVSLKLETLVDLVEEYGIYQSAINRWVEKLDDNIYEVRKEFGKLWHRVFFFKDTEQNLSVYIITHGISKKSNKTPKKEIDRANAIRKRYFFEEYGKEV